MDGGNAKCEGYGRIAGVVPMARCMDVEMGEEREEMRKYIGSANRRPGQASGRKTCRDGR